MYQVEKPVTAGLLSMMLLALFDCVTHLILTKAIQPYLCSWIRGKAKNHLAEIIQLFITAWLRGVRIFISSLAITLMFQHVMLLWTLFQLSPVYPAMPGPGSDHRPQHDNPCYNPNFLHQYSPSSPHNPPPWAAQNFAPKKVSRLSRLGGGGMDFGVDYGAQYGTIPRRRHSVAVYFESWLLSSSLFFTLTICFIRRPVS